MASRQNTTRKWVAKFCELMDWFLSLEKVHGDSLMEIHVKGLAANYLAVKLGIFDEAKAVETPDFLDKEPPYRLGDWECNRSEESQVQQIRQWRHERMVHWRLKAEQHGKRKRTRVQREVTQDNVRRYCDCLRGIMYRQKSGSWQADISDLAFEANDLAVKLGLTHPDWILAMRLGLWRYLEAPTIRELPLPRKHDAPPVVFQSVPVSVERMGNAVLADLEESIKRAKELNAGTIADAIPSRDFRSVAWYGTTYYFTATQAACVKILWEAWEAGTPDIGGDTILTEIDSDNPRISDLFKKHPAWNKMIVPGKSKGSYRLRQPHYHK